MSCANTIQSHNACTEHKASKHCDVTHRHKSARKTRPWYSMAQNRNTGVAAAHAAVQCFVRSCVNALELVPFQHRSEAAWWHTLQLLCKCGRVIMSSRLLQVLPCFISSRLIKAHCSHMTMVAEPLRSLQLPGCAGRSFKILQPCANKVTIRHSHDFHNISFGHINIRTREMLC